MRKYIIALGLILLILAGIGIYFLGKKTKTPLAVNSPSPSAISSPSSNPSSLMSPLAISDLSSPVNQFKERVTKKPFGIYITPQTSPIQPERFTGFHTGADAEYTDVTADVPVFAIADGKVVLSETASGYGGVFMISIKLNSTPHTVLYGHIRPSSLPKVGENVTKGEQIGLLGTGFSQETDGERRHLHFSFLSDNRQDIHGYVKNRSELSGWIDPLTFY